MRLIPFVLLVVIGCGDGPPVIGGEGGTPDAGLPTMCDVPGESEQVACGRCGEATRFCTVDGVWEYGPCSGESGTCAPGETDTVACGGCGTQLSVCNARCAWEPTGSCMSSGECEPGERERTSMGCDPGETRELLCSDACEFEESLECENDECDTPGEVESVSCGRCGTRERFCTSANVWEYGPCESEGVCDPGTTDSVACGSCGTQTSRCDTSCRWIPTGDCSDEGECAPGSTRSTSDGCRAGEQRLETCSATCDYVRGACTGGGTPGLGEACPGGSCEGALVCSDATDTPVCRENCTESGTCGGSRTCLDESVCSDACTVFTHAGCPTGTKCDLLQAGFFFETPITICSAIGTGGAGTSCTTNSRCRRDFVCLLDEGSTSGSCTAVCDDAHPCVSGSCSGVGGAGFCM